MGIGIEWPLSVRTSRRAGPSHVRFPNRWDRPELCARTFSSGCLALGAFLAPRLYRPVVPPTRPQWS